jgi:hypothetical protein
LLDVNDVFFIPQLEKSTTKAKDELAVIRHDTSDEDVQGWVEELKHIAREKENGKYTGMRFARYWRIKQFSGIFQPCLWVCNG